MRQFNALILSFQKQLVKFNSEYCQNKAVDIENELIDIRKNLKKETILI